MGSNHDFLKHSALIPLFNQKKKPSVQAIFKEYFVDQFKVLGNTERGYSGKNIKNIQISGVCGEENFKSKMKLLIDNNSDPSR